MSIRTPPAKWREVRDALPMPPRPDAPVAGGSGVTGGAADSYVRGSGDGHTCPRGDGWGNGELEFYTDRVANAHIDAGYLVIEARRESLATREYTSARLKTQGLGAWKYGRIEARIQIPRGQGLWPAFWMLGDNIPSAGWPGCGEIDIMENIGKEPGRVHGTVHGPGYSSAQGAGRAYDLPAGAFADTFHVYAVEWEPDAIRWYVDSTLYLTVTPKSLPGRWVYDHPFFIVLNVAVGGYWPGSPDATTVFPQSTRAA